MGPARALPIQMPWPIKYKHSCLSLPPELRESNIKDILGRPARGYSVSPPRHLTLKTGEQNVFGLFPGIVTEGLWPVIAVITTIKVCCLLQLLHLLMLLLLLLLLKTRFSSLLQTMPSLSHHQQLRACYCGSAACRVGVRLGFSLYVLVLVMKLWLLPSEPNGSRAAGRQ